MTTANEKQITEIEIPESNGSVTIFRAGEMIETRELPEAEQISL